MRNPVIVIMVLLATLPAALAGEETLAQLKARAESARLEDRPSLCTEIARRQVEAAAQFYIDGKPDDGRAAVAEIVTYSDKARDASIRTGKKLKQTEIGVRKMAARLRDIKRTLSFEEQAPVQAAVERLEQMRTELLARMFAKKEKK
jgi:hypothetical protein